MIKKIRFIEPGSTLPHKKSIANLFTYNQFIRNPSTGLILLTTITKQIVDDTLMYSEAISEIVFDDIYDADIVFIGINTFSAIRGYEIAKWIKKNSKAIVVFGGLHATLNYTESVNHGDYVLLGEGEEIIPLFIDAIQNERIVDFPGVAYKSNEQIIFTGNPVPPERFETIPDRHLVFKYHKVAKYDTLWPQVHASRGCPHNCDYCTVIKLFGRKTRTRNPENVIADIKQSIAFHHRNFIPRLNDVVWITDDNFHADREWAVALLNAIINSDLHCHFSIQARFEVGFDDELLDLMKKAGFIEVAMGIEFLEDESFTDFNKQSSRSEIVRSIQNIQKHGIGVRGLFMVGADNHMVGVGDKIVDFVIKNKIHGVLIQSMFFIPGTPAYDAYKNRLIHENWEKYNGNVVHFPKNIKPYELQQEIINASANIYSFKRLLHALVYYKWINKVLFLGEFFWHKSIRKELRNELPFLYSLETGR